MATLGVGEAEEQDYNHILLLPELPDSLQITLSPLLKLPGSLSLHLSYKDINPLPAVYASVTANAGLLSMDDRLQLSPRLTQMLAISLNIFFFKEENAYPLFLI